MTDPPAGSNVTRTTYRLAGGIVAIRKKEGTADTLYYPLTDHLGNVIALSDLHGNAVSGSDARYDPFGAFTTAPTTNPSVSNHGFTGHRHNNTGANNLGLIYMNARYYLPEVGRFISPDSIVPDPEMPQSYNRYAYGFNNPVKYVDPSGHAAECWTNDSNGSLVNCNDWMMEAIRILGLEGGSEGARLALLFWQWLNDPGKLLSIYAFKTDRTSMYTRQLESDRATINIGRDVITEHLREDIALLGHELEHVNQGTWQALSIQGEILAYQVQYRIHEAMDVAQDFLTAGAMGVDAYSYQDLVEARTGFLNLPDGPVNYNVVGEPNLPWSQEIGYQVEQVKSYANNRVSQIKIHFALWTNLASRVTP